MSEPVIIGNAELWLGDCREILPMLADGSVDMLWTDPPYGNGNADGDFLARRDTIMRDGRRTASVPIANDDMEAMRSVVDAALHEAARILKPDCCCCCCCCGGGPRPIFAWLAHRMDQDGLSFFHSVIWDKINPGIGWRYRRQHEMVMVAHRRGGKLAWNPGEPSTPNIIRLAKPRGNDHPNPKPVALVGRFIRAHSESGAVILDPFCGSGTTGVACANLGRKFIGVEIEERYFQIACERIEAAQAQGKLFANELDTIRGAGGLL